MHQELTEQQATPAQSNAIQSNSHAANITFLKVLMFSFVDTVLIEVFLSPAGLLVASATDVKY